MPPPDVADDLRQPLEDEVGRLEFGYWRTAVGNVQRPSRVGPGHLVRRASALEIIALSMQAQAEGRVADAWDRLTEAAALLPPQLVRRDRATGVALAVLAPLPPDTAAPDVRLVVRVARVIWREQHELADLRDRFAPGRMKPRDELVEGCIQYLMWVVFDPTSFYRPTPGESWDETTVEHSRTVLCRFGTEIRWLGDPTAGAGLSQAPWQDIGAYRGLAAEAFDRLADRPAAPWCGAKGTSGLVVRRGRLRAWEHACRRREDLRAL